MKVFNLLIITEVKLRKYMKSDEFGNWTSKAIIKNDAPTDDPRSDGQVPDQPVKEDPCRSASPSPPCDDILTPDDIVDMELAGNF